LEPLKPAPQHMLGLALPEPYRVASPIRGASLVSELAEALVLAHELDGVVAPPGWWGKRICRLLDSKCSVASTPGEVAVLGAEILEAIMDGSTPTLTIQGDRRILSYYIDTRKSRILYLGARNTNREPNHTRSQKTIEG